MDDYDVAIIGGGSAGLSAALVLGRARRRILVVDNGNPRNQVAEHMHGYLSRDGADPGELLSVGAAEVARYGGDFVDGTVDAVTGRTGRFVVGLNTGERIRAKRLLFATGVADELPDIPGMAQLWGKDVILCPYCHGYEVRDQPIAVLESVHHAELLRQWSANVTLVAGTPPTAEAVERLDALGVPIVLGEAAELTTADDRLTGIALADGRAIACTALFLASTIHPRDALLRELGAGRYDTPFGSFVAADVTGATDVPGVWAVGTVTDPSSLVIMAAAHGARAGAAINADLIAERTTAAITAARANRLEAAVTDQVLGDRKHGLETMIGKGA